MTNCPKCGDRLKVTDWRQNCPHCGVNLMFYGFEDRFYEDAKYAEMGFAKARVKLEKLRGGLIGSRFLIVRLCFVLLPVLALLLPVGKIVYTGVLTVQTYAVSGMGLYKAFTDGTIGQIFGEASALPVFGAAAVVLRNCQLCLMVAAMAAVLVLLLSILSFLSVKRMAVTICVCSALGAAASVACSAILFFAGKSLTETAVFQVGKGAGGFVMAGIFLLLLVCNALVAKNGVSYRYKEGDLYRVEVARKLKQGELTLADIPQPIYETEAEKETRADAIRKTIEETSEAVGGTAE